MGTSIYCPHCHKHTELSLGTSQFRWQGHQVEGPAICTDAWERNWWIGVCNSCKETCLVLGEGDIIYPHPLPTPTDPEIPKDIATDLDEAKLCFSVSCYRACAAMARRTIQLTCITKGASKGDLVGQIAELAASGVITKDLAEWATVVRWIGNDAAHPNPSTVTQEDAADCLHLAEQFLHVIFVTPARAKARRAARGK